MTGTLKVTKKFHVVGGRTGHKTMRAGRKAAAKPVGRIPRVSRLMALAIRFEQLLREGVVADQAEIARLTFVSRARVTQIMDLLLLAPDIQEAILHLPAIDKGRDPVTERELRAVVAEADWGRQRGMWMKGGKNHRPNHCAGNNSNLSVEFPDALQNA